MEYIDQPDNDSFREIIDRIKQKIESSNKNNLIYDHLKFDLNFNLLDVSDICSTTDLDYSQDVHYFIIFRHIDSNEEDELNFTLNLN